MYKAIPKGPKVTKTTKEVLIQLTLLALIEAGGIQFCIHWRIRLQSIV